MDRAAIAKYCAAKAKQMAIAMAIGAVVSTFYAVGRPEGVTATMVVAGAFIGICIYVLISLFFLGFNRIIRLLSPPTARLAEAAIYLVGGAAGWIIGVTLVNSFLDRRLSVPSFGGNAQTFMVLTAVVVLVTGILFRVFETMQEKVRQTEWAQRELGIARAIQERLLPPAVVTGVGFTVTTRNLPAHYVAGDFYDVVPLDDGSLMLVLADVAGKGIGAGLIMSSVKAVLPFVARSGVVATMAALNEKLSRELAAREFVALVCVRYQPATGSIEVANGGCPDPYVLHRDRVETVSCAGIRLPLGLNRGGDYTIARSRIEPGERLVLLSDGIPEAPTLNGHPLGYDVVEKILADLTSAPQRGMAWLDMLIADVQQRVEPSLADDWTVLILDRATA